MTSGSVPLRARAWEWLRDPVVWVEVLQLVKTVLAAVLAWTIADQVLGLGQAFLAPWAALLVVHATVYRTVSRGAQQVAMTFLGVLLAFGAASVWGVGTASLAAVVALGLAAGLPRVVRAEGSTAAGTAVLVLLAGYSEEQGMLFDRLADTAVGVVVGLAVVVLVRPPLHDRALVRRIALIEASIGELLGDMATGLAGNADQETAEVWMDATRRLDDDVDWAAAMLRQASESGRMNPRRSARPRLLRVASWADVVDRLEQAVSDARSMARTLQRQLEAPGGWDQDFRDGWLALLTETSRAIAGDDEDRLIAVRDELDRLVRDLFEADDSVQQRPLHGALVLNLRNIIDGMADVAAAQAANRDPVTR